MAMVVFVFVSAIGVLSTYLLTNYSTIGAVKSSVLCTLLFLVALRGASLWMEVNQDLPSVFFGASFVGMSSKKMIDWRSAVIASILYAFLLYFSLPYFAGIGGALGTSAAITVITLYLVKIGYKKRLKKHVRPNR